MTFVRRLGIRHRLVAGIVVLLAIVLVGAGVLVTDVLRTRLVADEARAQHVGRTHLVADVDDQLGQRTTTIARALRPRGLGFPGDRFAPNLFTEQRSAYVQLDTSGAVVAAIPLVHDGRTESLPDVAGMRATPKPRTVASVDHDGPRYRVRGIDIGNGVLVAAIPLSEVDATVQSAQQALLLGGLLTLVAAAAVVWVTVRRGLRPIDAMVTTAQHIAGGDLTERAEVPDPNTEVGHLGTALNTMLDNVEAAVAAKSASEARLRRFAADASHELRTPLTSIRGYAELYRQGATDPDAVARGMARIEHEATRMSTLVEDLLLLARLDQGHDLRLEHVDLGAVVDHAVETARVIEPARAITVGRPASPVIVEGDADRLRQVIDNLLTNVREHTGGDAAVTVTLSGDERSATLVVADDGPGMTDEEADRAFERFWQGEQTVEHPRQGTGLGLAIVQDLVRTHGGTVTLTTSPGAGATFTITIPTHRFGGDSQANDSPAQDGTGTLGS